jgi:hypothetical protein
VKVPTGGFPLTRAIAAAYSANWGAQVATISLTFPSLLPASLCFHDHQAVGRADEEVNPPDNSLESSRAPLPGRAAPPHFHNLATSPRVVPS